MAVKSIDRRVEKTRKALKDALINLIQDKSFESICIQEILDKANVGRSTFYVHYECKNDLLHDCFQDFSKLLEMDKRIAHLSNGEDFLLGLFRFIEQNKQLVKAFLGRDSIGILHHPIMDYTYRLARLSLEQQVSKKHPPIPPDLVVHCFACELIGTLRWWLYSSMLCTADDIYHYFVSIAFGGLKDALS